VNVLIDLAAVAIAVSVLLSTALFIIEVLIKRRHVSGQIIGLIFSLIVVPLYFIVFCDRLPGHSLGLRRILLLLPGVYQANIQFSSSVAILIALVVTYALRLGIYTRLFVIPALTMSEAEYRSRDEVEYRANDLTAPVLAYLTFALVLTAMLAGSYGLPPASGAAICVLLLLLYFGSSFLRNLRNSVIWMAVQFRIFLRNVWIYTSRAVVYFVLVIGRMEAWRRRQQPGDEQFFQSLTERIRQSERKAKAKNEEERELLRRLAMGKVSARHV
jgi:hypothetical protein